MSLLVETWKRFHKNNVMIANWLYIVTGSTRFDKSGNFEILCPDFPVNIRVAHAL